MFTYCIALLRQVRTDRKGVTALEYGVIAAAIVVTLSVSMPLVATQLGATFTTITTALTP